MKKILTLIFLLICTISYAQRPKIVRHFGNETGIYGREIVTDGSSIWLTGEFSDDPASFIVKYRPDGNCDWQVRIEGEPQVKSSASAEDGTLWLLARVDQKEALYYITSSGTVSSPIRLKDLTGCILKDFIKIDETFYICGNEGDKYLLAACSTNGELLWKNVQNEYTSASGEKVITDGANIILSGTCAGNTTGNTDLFITKFNTSGQQSWSCKITGNGQEQLSDMACLSDGKLLLSGSTTSRQLTVGTEVQNTTSTGIQHALCLMLNPDGSYSSLLTAGGTSAGKNTMINTVAIGEDDKIYAAGYCMGKVIFNPTGVNRYNLPDKGAKDAFIMKLSPGCEIQDVKRFGNKTNEEIADMLFTTTRNGGDLYTLTNFREASEYGTIYKTTNLALSGTLPYSLDAIGTENNTVLSGYAYSRIFANISVHTDHITPAEEGIYYRACVYHRGGSRKVTYELHAGELPLGMSLSAQGDLSGIPAATGTFELSIRGTDEQGNSDISTFTWQIEPNGLVGISSPETTRPYLFPNPVEKEFFIRGSDNGILHIYIVSAQGHLMMEKTLTDQTEAINISGFPKGIYLVKCISGQSTWSEKLIMCQ